MPFIMTSQFSKVNSLPQSAMPLSVKVIVGFSAKPSAPLIVRFLLRFMPAVIASANNSIVEPSPAAATASSSVAYVLSPTCATSPSAANAVVGRNVSSMHNAIRPLNRRVFMFLFIKFCSPF